MSATERVTVALFSRRLRFRQTETTYLPVFSFKYDRSLVLNYQLRFQRVFIFSFWYWTTAKMAFFDIIRYYKNKMPWEQIVLLPQNIIQKFSSVWITFSENYNIWISFFGFLLQGWLKFHKFIKSKAYCPSIQLFSSLWDDFKLQSKYFWIENMFQSDR